MSTKFGYAGGIPERRVRPIWDAIDSRQFKNALKLSTALLSKYTNSPYALALKALVLERMGKPEEALSICLEAKEFLYKNDSLLMDDLTLSTLQIVFQRLDRLDLATSCYEHACGKFSNNLELMMGLFNCYVREYSFVKQQQTAIKMYKLVGEERFLLWAICSIQLQVFCGNGGEKLLLLAEGLLKKHIASHSLHEPEALIVYISILEQQAKYGDALEVLSGKLGSLLMIEVDKLRIQGRLLAQTGDYVSAENIYQKILEICPDDWEAFQHYLGCLLEDGSSWRNEADSSSIHPPKNVDCEVSHLSDDKFESSMENATALVQKLLVDTSTDPVRGPYLAALEIRRRKHVYGKGSDDEIMEALIEYYLKFGHLACFSSDIVAFLQPLTPEKKTEFVDKLVKNCDSMTVIGTKVLGQSITIFKIRNMTGNMHKLPVVELENFVVDMVTMFCKSLPLSKDLDPQESMHGEELLSMASNLLVQYKILLVHLYSHLGILSLAYEWYRSLDVKNILTETISHHILPQMLVSPLWDDLQNLLKDYLRFMDDHLRESADLTFLAYRHRNYSKVIEFVQFKEHLQRSDQYLVAKVETSILQLKQNADCIEEEENVLEGLDFGNHFVELCNEVGSKSLTFNEDLSMRPWWTPTSEKNYLLGPFEGIDYYPKKELAKEREEKVRKVIEKKSLLPRLIYLSVQSASTLNKGNAEMNGSTSDPKISKEFKFLLERYANLLGSTLDDAIKVVLGVSTGQKSSEAFGSDSLEWLNFAVFLNAWNLSSHELSHEDGSNSDHGILHAIDTLLVNHVSENMKLTGSLELSGCRDLSALVQLVTEPLAWHSLVLQSCVRSSVPSGKKKKKGGPTDHPNAPLLNALRDSTQSLYGIVEEVTKWLRNQINKPEESQMDMLLSSITTNREDEGPGRAFQALGSLIPSLDKADVGERIYIALISWNPVDVARKVATGHTAVLSRFLQICTSKIKSLQALQQKIAQV
ncbi:N-terminal acetyltransferase B complex auxiliary subunit NAA25 [Linum perenne]